MPWIRNATLRENVLFGQPDDEDRFVVSLVLCLESKRWFWVSYRFREVIRACKLDDDLEVLPHPEILEVLPHRENTEIGEKGINLSGMFLLKSGDFDSI